MSRLVYYDLIKAYAHVCNAALTANKHRFPYKHIFDAAENDHIGERIEVLVDCDVPSLESYVFEFKGYEIKAKLHDICKNCGCVRHWHVSLDYLKDVSAHPDKYIQNPAMIDWEWLYDTKH